MKRETKVIIATHYLVYGAAQALRDFLNKKKFSAVLYIQSPLLDSQKSLITLFKKGEKQFEKKINRKSGFYIGKYLRDLFIIIQAVFLKKEKYDLFIGVDSLNCLGGLFLKKLGKVRKVIFYSIDFVPIRFDNKFLNRTYHAIENYCVTHSDEVWNVSPRIAEGREKFFNISKKNFPQKIVPIGVWSEDIKKRPFEDVKKHQIFFIGHLLEKQGVQLILEAMPSIIKQIEDAHFLIVGGGEYEEYLKKLVNELHIQEHVTFGGWVKERKKIDEMISESAIAVAAYKPEKEKLYNFTYYADPTKLKDYLGSGVPIVLTDVSYNAKEIAEKKCGILVEYNKEEIAKSIITLLHNEKVLQNYRNNALLYAKSFDWEEIFTRTLS